MRRKAVKDRSKGWMDRSEGWIERKGVVADHPASRAYRACRGYLPQRIRRRIRRRMDGGIERRIRCRCDLPAAKEKEEVKDGWMVRRGEKNCLPACQPATLPTRCLPISHPATLPTSLPVKDPLSSR